MSSNIGIARQRHGRPPLRIDPDGERRHVRRQNRLELVRQLLLHRTFDRGTRPPARHANEHGYQERRHPGSVGHAMSVMGMVEVFHVTIVPSL